MQVRANNDEGNGPWSRQRRGQHPGQERTRASSPTLQRHPRASPRTRRPAATSARPSPPTDTESNTLYYSLNGTDKDEFNIGLNTGQITVKSGKIPDYEAKTSYSLIVEVSDRKDTDDNADTKIDDTITVTINVTNVNEPPAAPSISVSTNTTTPDSKIGRVLDGPGHDRQAAYQRLRRAVQAVQR